MARDMSSEGLIEVDTALLRLDANRLEELFKKVIAEKGAGAEPIATGLNASPGAASAARPCSRRRRPGVGHPRQAVILVQQETTPDDYHGMIRSEGIPHLGRGDQLYAAVVARGEGIPAVARRRPGPGRPPGQDAHRWRRVGRG